MNTKHTDITSYSNAKKTQKRKPKNNKINKNSKMAITKFSMIYYFYNPKKNKLNQRRKKQIKSPPTKTSKLKYNKTTKDRTSAKMLNPIK